MKLEWHQDASQFQGTKEWQRHRPRRQIVFIRLLYAIVCCAQCPGSNKRQSSQPASGNTAKVQRVENSGQDSAKALAESVNKFQALLAGNIAGA